MKKEDIKHFTLRLQKETYRELKEIAVEDCHSLNGCIAQILKQYLRDRKQGRDWLNEYPIPDLTGGEEK